jgi:hypothetical protein
MQYRRGINGIRASENRSPIPRKKVVLKEYVTYLGGGYDF